MTYAMVIGGSAEDVDRAAASDRGRLLLRFAQCVRDHEEAPFGGYGQSGIGRELGIEALDRYTETKSVFVDLS